MADLKALFVTTATSEPVENVRAWEHVMGPAAHITFDLNSPPNDAAILQAARDFRPDVIFYTGATDGPGLPSDDTLRALREDAKTVIFQGDFGDPPWWPMIAHYRKAECFDLYVSMDGVKSSPVDLVGLTPFDPERFTKPHRHKTIRCGFGGNLIPRDKCDEYFGKGHTVDPRSALMHSLGDLVRVRVRETEGDYDNYIAFFRRCELVINTSWAGSGTAHHVKGRTLEAGFSGACILEMRDSPLGDWFPADTFFTYRDAEEARAIILGADRPEIERRARAYEAHARENYTADKIYHGIVERLGL